MPVHNKRVALVTGGNRGIGYAIGRSLAQRGITVILGVRDPGKGATACSRLQGEDTPVWLATLPDGGPTGGFYRERTRIPW